MPEVTDPNLLAMLNGGGAAPAAPGVILGRPKSPTPLQISAEARAEEDQRMQRDRDAIAREKTALDIEKARRDLVPGADTTESEKTAGFLATRVAGGIKDLNSIAGKNKDAMQPTFGVEAVRSIFGDTAANYFTDADRQQVVAAQKDILDAALTLGTGAAYTTEQLDGYRKSYFPQLGDDAATVAAKQKRLIRLLESAKVKAGRSAPMIDEALQAVGDFEEAELVEFDLDPNVQMDGAGNVVNTKTGEIVQRPDPGSGGYSLNEAASDFGAGVGDVVEGVGDVLGLVGNPLNAGINAITGSNLSTDLGQTFRDATGLPKGRSELASAINKGGVSALTGFGSANLVRPVATGTTRVVSNALASQPVQQVIGGSAAAGSADLARQAGAPVPVQVAAGLVGGVAGYSGTNALANAGRARVATPLAKAAGNQGIDLMPADVGGPMTRRLSSAASQGVISAPSITRAARNSQDQFASAARRASGGNALPADEAGQMISKAGERFNKNSRATGGRLYDRAEKMAQGVSIKAKGAIATIDEQIAELSQAKEVNAPLITALERFKSDLGANNGIRVAGMRDLRSAAQKAAYTEDMRSTPAQRVLGIVADAIGNDIDAGLAAAGRQNAAQAFKTADAYWRDRVQYIDDVLEPVIGKGKSGESVLGAVEQMAQGKGRGVQNLMKLMRSVDESEAADIQATLIDRLGKSSAGNQNDEGTAYSAATFLTNWNKMSGKGKAALFPDQNLRRNLDDLAKIADSMKESSRFANSSNTAGALAGQIALSGGVGLGISPTAMMLAGGSQYLTGRLLASPGFARWLAKAPSSPSPTYMKRLDAIAASEPIIANDIASVKRFLDQAPGLSRAAASDEIGEERPVKP